MDEKERKIRRQKAETRASAALRDITLMDLDQLVEDGVWLADRFKGPAYKSEPELKKLRDGYGARYIGEHIIPMIRKAIELTKDLVERGEHIHWDLGKYPENVRKLIIAEAHRQEMSQDARAHTFGRLQKRKRLKAPKPNRKMP